MTELDKITTEVLPTSFDRAFNPVVKDREKLYADIISYFEFNLDQHSKFKEGIVTEKLNKTLLLKMFLEVIIHIVENSKKPQSGENKTEDILHLQNKKIVKDLAFSLFNILNNYDYNDKELKILLMGKLLQSLHGS